MIKQFTGTAVAVITPFKSDKSIDFEALTNIINHQISFGIDYIVALGSTGEAATLSTEEKHNLRKHFVQVVAGRVPIVVGVGGNNTGKVVAEIEQTDFTGFDAILSVSPSYNKPSQEGIYQHYKAIATVSPLPILLYNVPGRTGMNINPSTVFRLAQDFKNIIGIKEAAGDMAQILQLLQHKPADFLVISGDDLLALPLVLAGGDGVISVIAMGFTTEFSTMIHLGMAGNNNESFKIHYKVMDAIDLIFDEGNPTGIKALLHIQGFCENELRLPLMKASSVLEKRIAAIL